MKLIAGLGNPESRYAATRHNVGFEAAEMLRRRLGFGRELLRFHACISKGTVEGEQVIICRPQTYMNSSGIAIGEIASFYKIKPEDILIIYDDVSLPFGTLRVRGSGSAGGHNGMKSIIARLGTEDFPRVRLGMGEKPEGWDLADYVLAHFSEEELPVVRSLCESAADAAEAWIKNGIAYTMNHYNRKANEE